MNSSWTLFEQFKNSWTSSNTVQELLQDNSRTVQEQFKKSWRSSRRVEEDWTYNPWLLGCHSVFCQNWILNVTIIVIRSIWFKEEKRFKKLKALFSHATRYTLKSCVCNASYRRLFLCFFPEMKWSVWNIFTEEYF